jgi:hypothetical protein
MGVWFSPLPWGEDWVRVLKGRGSLQIIFFKTKQLRVAKFEF